MVLKDAPPPGGQEEEKTGTTDILSHRCGQGTLDATGGRARNEDADSHIEPFRYLDKGSMATIGRSAAVCKIGSLELTGLIGWLGWLLVHIYYLIGFRNRLVVLASWCWNYIWYDRPVRIIAEAEPPKLLPQQPKP